MRTVESGQGRRLESSVPDSFRIVEAREFADFLMILKLEPISGGGFDDYVFVRYGKPGEEYLAEMEERYGEKVYKIRIR